LSNVAPDRCEDRWQLRDIGSVGAKLRCDDDLRLCVHCGLCIEALFEAYAGLHDVTVRIGEAVLRFGQ
jgi:hypothetical protein